MLANGLRLSIWGWYFLRFVDQKNEACNTYR